MQKLTRFLVFICLITVQHLTAQPPQLILPIGHTSFLTCGQFSPDGKRILTASMDYTANLWDAVSGSLLVTFKGHSGMVRSAVFSPDGRMILTASDDRTVKVWDAVSGNLLKTLKGHTGSVNSIVFSPDAKRVLTTSRDSTTRLWNVFSGNLLNTFRGDAGYIQSAVFSPDGKKILTESPGNGVMLCDAASGDLVRTFKGHTSFIKSAIFSSDGKKILTTSRDSTAILWDAGSGSLRKTFEGRAGGITSALFNPDGKTILTMSVDNTASTWSAFSGTLIKTFTLHAGIIYSPIFSPDGKQILTMSKYRTVNTWDAVTGSLLNTFEGHVNGLISAVFSKDGKKILTTSWDSTAKVWDAASGTLIKTFTGHASHIKSAIFSADAKWILTAYGDNTVKLWDAFSGNLLKTFKGHKAFIMSAVFSQDAKKIVTTSGDSTIKVWDAVSGSLINTFEGHTDLFEPPVLSADGKKILIAFGDSLATLWDVVSGTLLKTFKCRERVISAVFSPDEKKILTASSEYKKDRASTWDVASGNLLNTFHHKEWIRSAVFSPDGKRIVTASEDDSVRIWDAGSGNLLKTFNGYDDIFIHHPVFSPDGKKILTRFNDTTIKLWDAVSGDLLTTIRSALHTSPGMGASIMAHFNRSPVFSPDGKKILTSCRDYTASTWDAASGNLIKTFPVHTNSVTSAVFSPNGKKILTASWDNTVKIWDAVSGHLLYTFFALDSTDYLGQIPSGYYRSTQNAARLLHYVTRDLKVITFEQLDIRYNRPDKVLGAMQNPDVFLISAYRNAYEKRIKKLAIDTTAFREGYGVPDAGFINQEDINYEQTSDKLTLHLVAKDSAYRLDHFNVWVNEVPLFGVRGISIKGDNRKMFDTTVTIKLSQGENRLECSVINANGIESYRSPLLVRYLPVKPKAAKLYFIGIGINEFSDSRYNLSWSVKDISDLSERLKTKYGEHCEIDTLFNQSITIGKIKALKQKLLQTGENDKVIVAYSGHGLLSKAYDYYLSTYAVNFEKPEQNGLLYDELENLLDSIPARKKLMLLDACHSGEVDKEELSKMVRVQRQLNPTTKGVIASVDTSNRRLDIKNSFELMQELFVNVGKRTGATIISAAAGTQFALERGDLQNGVFTYCILEAMKKFSSINVSELKRVVEQRVEQLTQGLQKPTSRDETLEYDWQVW